MSRGRADTIQISLGSTSNAITAHLLNLEGLAATSNTDDDVASPVCDAQTTHSVQNNHWVPRVLMVDEPTRYFVPQISQTDVVGQQQNQLGSFGVEAFTDPSWTLQHETPTWNSIFTNASVLAYSSHSRYYQEPEEQQTSYRASDSNPRHVVWDDDEPEVEEEEDPQDRLMRLQRQRNDWSQNTRAPIEEQLQQREDWNDLFQTHNFLDFFMPPYSPKSLLALPFSGQSTLVSNWNTFNFHSDSTLKEWKEDVLLEGLRRLLEDSDGCQGVSIMSEGSGLYAGLTTDLLHELQEECMSAGRIVYHVTNPADTLQQKPNKDGEMVTAAAQTDKDWHTLHVDRLRKYVGSGLALSDFCQNAHAVLPLQLSCSSIESSSFFENTARLAMAMEASTLPVRLSSRKDPRYQIGLQNVPFFGGQDTRYGSCGSRLSVSELLQCLQPSKQYSVLELDTSATGVSCQDVWNHLKVGTSLERDQRMRDSGRDGQLRRPVDSMPGAWLDDVQLGGMLQSLTHDNSGSRSLHHHFALGVSMRTQLQDENISDYSTCIAQGMGIRYRPERSMCSVLNQTVSQLTNNGGGAGSYWRKVMGDSEQQPVVSVLGNTTRIYPLLDKISSEFKSILGAKYRNYYQRDVVNGTLPEMEDCEEAVANCLDIRDTYYPPEGSGLVDDEGADFM